MNNNIWVSGNDLLKMEVPKNNMLWEHFLPYKQMGMLVGPSDCGKSRLLRQLALAIVAGKDDFLGYKLNPKNGKVCYISTEDNDIIIKGNLEREADAMGIKDLGQLYYLFDNDNIGKELKSFLKVQKVDLVILDTWSDTYQGNPNDFVSVRRNFDPYSKICNEYDCSMLFLHHNVKNSENHNPDKNKINGSMGIESKLRLALELRNGNKSDESILTITKANHLPRDNKEKGMLLKLDPGTLIYSNTGELKDFKKGTTENKAKYDKGLWVQRMMDLKKEEGLSYDGAREKLVTTYPDEEVPGLTWFKENCKESDGQSDSIEEIATD